jgi:lysozyme
MGRKRKKSTERKKGILLFLLPIILMGGAIWYYSHLWPFQATKFKHYPGFAIDIPQGYQIHGIDVSKYQGNIWWSSVKEMKIKDVSIQFVFIKATEGYTLTDKTFSRNWREAKKSGITRGAYHFFTAGKDGTKQAEHFLKKVTLATGDLPPVLDIEETNSKNTDLLRQELKEWLVKVEEKAGKKPIIYTNADFYNRYLAGHFDEYPLWVAHYYQKDEPDVNRKWIFWQHNDKGKINGIKESVDFNVFYGSKNDFQKLLLN